MSDLIIKPDADACDVCRFEPGQILETFKYGSDFELIDDRGETKEVREGFRICETCYKESHDTHWYATHPEFLGFSESAED